jgi:hypothetical protein
LFVGLIDDYISERDVVRLSKLIYEVLHAFLKRVRVYAFPDAKIFNPKDWVDWAIYWKQEHDSLQSRALEHGLAVLGDLANRRLTQMRIFYTQVSDILGTLADIVQPRTLEELERYGFNDQSAGER